MGACTSKDDAASAPSNKNQTAFKDSDELKDFDTFFRPGNNSSLAKFMSKEIWEEYKDQSCDAGVSFKVCIFSGIKNQDSGIGVYAGSHGSYMKFNKHMQHLLVKWDRRVYRLVQQRRARRTWLHRPQPTKRRRRPTSRRRMRRR